MNNMFAVSTSMHITINTLLATAMSYATPNWYITCNDIKPYRMLGTLRIMI